MKSITLSIREFYLFKTLANFFFDVTIHKDKVIITAEKSLLEHLGY